MKNDNTGSLIRLDIALKKKATKWAGFSKCDLALDQLYGWKLIRFLIQVVGLPAVQWSGRISTGEGQAAHLLLERTKGSNEMMLSRLTGGRSFQPVCCKKPRCPAGVWSRVAKNCWKTPDSVALFLGHLSVGAGWASDYSLLRTVALKMEPQNLGVSWTPEVKSQEVKTMKVTKVAVLSTLPWE